MNKLVFKELNLNLGKYLVTRLGFGYGILE